MVKHQHTNTTPIRNQIQGLPNYTKKQNKKNPFIIIAPLPLSNNNKPENTSEVNSGHRNHNFWIQADIRYVKT